MSRNVDEKQPWLFTQMRDTLGDNNIQFINTLEHNFSKQEYYELLAKSKVVVSFALQENFGFSVAIDGNYAIVGAYFEDHQDANGANFKNNAGSAYIFERDTSGNWSQKPKIVANDREA